MVDEKKYTKVTAFRIPEADHAYMERVAKEKGITKKEVLILALQALRDSQSASK